MEVVVRLSPNICLWIWRIWAPSLPYHPEYSINTNIDFDHPDYFTSLEGCFNAFNDYAKQTLRVFFTMVKMRSCVRLRLMLRFIIMVLKQKVMTLSLATFIRFNNWFNLHSSFPWSRIRQFTFQPLSSHQGMRQPLLVFYTADLNLREHLKTFCRRC